VRFAFEDSTLPFPLLSHS